MDDLKLFAKDDNNLEKMLPLVKKFSDDIGMTFGLDKFAKVSFKRGKLIRSVSLELDRHGHKRPRSRRTLQESRRQ